MFEIYDVAEAPKETAAFFRLMIDCRERSGLPKSKNIHDHIKALADRDDEAATAIWKHKDFIDQVILAMAESRTMLRVPDDIFPYLQKHLWG